jgi:signal transduction histidine kinase
LQRIAQSRDIGIQIMTLLRGVLVAPLDQRDAVLRDLLLRDGFQAEIASKPPPDDLLPTPMPLRRPIVVNMQLVNVPPQFNPAVAQARRDIVMLGGPEVRRLVIGMHLPDDTWLNVTVPFLPPRIWQSPNLLAAFLVMSVAAILITFWSVRRLTSPVRTLARAAEVLGRDVNAPPLPEDGPSEVATAAIAFNTMAARIRRFVQDRTFMLTAIGHDLRTPITRLKLRCEFLDDEDMRRKMLADLGELEAMVSATLAFGRDVTADEPVVSVDLAQLVRTVLDEASDARCEQAEQISYSGPSHLPFRGRTLGLKRAITNLVNNALDYGQAASVCLKVEARVATLTIDDNGPGIPVGELDRVFAPFHRVEASRNRETGGVGLGLPITRNIIRAHGGDVVLMNRPVGGARAVVTLPI